MQIVEQIVTLTVATATKSTQQNIKKLRVYLSNEKKSGRNTKQIYQ